MSAGRQFSHEHQVAAGKARYRQMVSLIIGENPTDENQAALRLSCLRLNMGFRFKRGLTGQYMIDKAREYGLEVAFAKK